MQPTLLVESKKTSQATDFSDLNKASSAKRRALVRPLKSVGWAAAFGSLFIFAQSYALSLQNMQINSALGEPLDAIVMVNAAPGEVLQASCMRTGFDADSGMPGIRGVRLSLSRQMSPGTIRLTTRRPVTEPMSEIVVHIECPGAPSIKRSFLIMLDPRGATVAATPIPTGSSINPGTAEQGYEKPPEALNPSASKIRPLSVPVISSADNRVNVRSRQVIVSRGTPVDPGSDYLVVTGDALSTIAARITGRDYGTVWSWAATIQSVNPHAFINGNPNELMAGTKLYVPNTLAAGTVGLTVPRATNAVVTSNFRYSDSFSSRTNELATLTPDTRTARSAPIEPPVAVSTQQSAASGAIRAIQPVMVMATSFSSVSRDRLQQRNRGLIQAAPENLPDFVVGDVAQSQMAKKAAQDALNNNQGQPEPEGTQSPEAVVAAKPEAATAPTSGRRISLLGILGGLGLLASAFFTGWWLSRRRANSEMQEILEARLNEERYRDRVRSGRQDAIREGLSNGAAAAGIHVTETAPEPTLKPSAFSEDDLDEVISSALSEEQALEQEESLDVNIAEPIVDNDSPMIDPIELEFDVDDNHELADIDLELLERDYAAQTETNTGLEDIAAAGQGTSTLADSNLDMEFPEDVKMRSETLPRFDTLEFDPRAEPLDFDIGSGVIEDETNKTEALGLELEEAGASIDAHLEQLRKEDSEQVELDPTAEIEMNPTEQFEIDPTTEHEITDLVIENLLEDDAMNATSTRDAEEFYHLEASSIMNVGELDFEKGPDDETNILRFRQRNIRTGTDDSSNDED